MKRILILVAALILTGNIAHAKDEKARFTGAGAVSCGEFAEKYRRDTGVEHFFFTWAQGFMSGLNVGLKSAGLPMRDLRARDIQSQKLAMRSYCNDHPLDVYMSAVKALFITLPER